MRQERRAKTEGEVEGSQRSMLELIAAFIDGTIDDAQKEDLLSVLADDEDAYEVFVGTVEYLRTEAEAAEREKRERKRARLITAVALLVVASALFFFIWRTT